jgi:predicted lipid carrier protein YhbT
MRRRMLTVRLAASRLNDQSRNVHKQGSEAMADSVQEFFDGLAGRVDDSKTAGMNNSYFFDIDGAGKWVVAVEDGKVTVSEGEGEADTTITTSEENFLSITRGELNPTSAYMTGKLKIKGDMGAAMKLQKLF